MTPELCSADSGFRASFESCEECTLNQPDYTSPDYTSPDYTSPDYTSPDYTLPDYASPEYLADLQELIDYCNELSPTSQDTRATSQLLPPTSEALTATS
ncbi:Pseudouridine-5'-phosphate glycosidase, partial [Madurella mycetomatis]